MARSTMSFFDDKKILKAAKKKAQEAVNEAAKELMKIAKDSIKRATKKEDRSAPGQPPKSHKTTKPG